MIVSRVDNVVSIEPDRIIPLSPIFKGSAMSCFPNVLKHKDATILILAPEGLMKVLDILGAAIQPVPVSAGGGGGSSSGGTSNT